MEIERELTFEDISVHSPGAFSKGDAMRQLRTAPNAHSLRVALAELDQTSQSLTQMLNGAKEKALGNSDKDLERIKNNVKRMKFGTVELGTECAFLRRYGRTGLSQIQAQRLRTLFDCCRVPSNNCYNCTQHKRTVTCVSWSTG
tara:strand:- start:1729 stop:2160 length:432 start_codon:yes stop_codon:yes gene_type:complete